MNLNKMMKQAQEMQQKMADMQDKIADIEIEGTSGAGMVTLTFNGKGEARKASIDPKLVDPEEVEILEDLIVAAINDAKNKTEKIVGDKMSEVTSGLNLPPGMKLPF